MVTIFNGSPYVSQYDCDRVYQGTTTNPLVIGSNDTVNPDKRIFSSDKDRTISNLVRKSSIFEEKCAKIFSQMIDTVSKSVKLSSRIEPIDIKSNVTKLYLNNEGSLVFSGRVRVRTKEGAKRGRDPTDLFV